MEQNVFHRRLQELVALGDPKAFDVMAFEIGNNVLEEGIFPSETFIGLPAIFAEEKFQQSDGSWKLIRVFEGNWEQLSEEQRNTLLPVLESHYESLSDWMACFVISGILGELYADARAFQTLCRLSKCHKEVPRSFVPHGFEHVVSDALDAELAMQALAELTKMQTDPSPMVRGEVKESLDRIKKRQTRSPS
jgi:hypothetical protein